MSMARPGGRVEWLEVCIGCRSQQRPARRDRGELENPCSGGPLDNIANLKLRCVSNTTSGARHTMVSNDNQARENAGPISLPVLDKSQAHRFLKPAKKINEGHDVPIFLTTQAYSDIGLFIMQLNIAMCPRKSSEAGSPRTWQLDGTYSVSEPVQKLQALLNNLESIIEEAPPDTGPRRFGNISFRKWYEILESRVQGLLEEHLPSSVLGFKVDPGGTSVLEELTPYLLGGFGSSQRLDYGTGHELSFLAFLGCIWKLGGFSAEKSRDGDLERSLVLGVIEPYVPAKQSL